MRTGEFKLMGGPDDGSKVWLQEWGDQARGVPRLVGEVWQEAVYEWADGAYRFTGRYEEQPAVRVVR